MYRNVPVIRIAARTLCFFFVCGMFGCARHVNPKVINAGLSSYFQPERIRTIAMMPLQIEAGDAGVAEAVMRELTVQILQLDRFEIIDHYKVSALVAEEDLEGAELNDAVVRTIGRKLRADAILLGKVTQYQVSQRRFLLMKEAPVISLSLRVLSVKDRTPKTIWSVNDTFSGADRAVQLLVSEVARGRIKTDIRLLTQVMTQEIAKTLNF